MAKITKRLVDALVPDARGEVFAWDSELRGFGVRMMSSGVASYVLKYRPVEGLQRKLVLGRVGAITPDEARRLAREKAGEIARGGDPSAERHKLRAAITVAELCDLYLAEAEGRVKTSTMLNNRSCLERHVKPLIGRRTAISLTHEDIARMQADIVAGKTATERSGRGGVTRGGRSVTSRTVVVFGAVLEFARKRKVVRENVVRGVERAPDVKRKRYLSAAEIRALGKAMREAEDEGETAVGIASVRFLLLTGCRRMEVLALPKLWLDESHGCIRFGDTKSGAQLRPIGQVAFGVLPTPRPGSPWVFPAGRGEGHFVSLPKVLERLCDRAKLVGVSVHVLRHSFAATAAGMGYSELTISGLLGHSVSGVTARYAYVPDAALVAAANAVASRIRSEMLMHTLDAGMRAE